jgi:hypothetical protein
MQHRGPADKFHVRQDFNDPDTVRQRHQYGIDTTEIEFKRAPHDRYPL